MTTLYLPKVAIEGNIYELQIRRDEKGKTKSESDPTLGPKDKLFLLKYNKDGNVLENKPIYGGAIAPLGIVSLPPGTRISKLEDYFQSINRGQGYNRPSLLTGGGVVLRILLRLPRPHLIFRARISIVTQLPLPAISILQRLKLLKEDLQSMQHA